MPCLLVKWTPLLIFLVSIGRSLCFATIGVISQPGLDKSEKKQKKALKKKKNRKPDDNEVLAVPEKFTKGKRDYTGRGKAKAPTDGYKKNKKWCPLHQQVGRDLRTCRAWQKKLEDYYAGKGPLPSIQELERRVPKRTKMVTKKWSTKSLNIPSI